MLKLAGNLLALFLISYLGASALAQPTPADTHALLSQLETEHDHNGHFATLFRTGDERIEDLIRALDDPDSNVKQNAQTIIRYLGNRVGMAALFRHYTESNSVEVVGPVPLPLTDWDYDFIESTYLNRPGNFGGLSTQYLYALSLDGSQRAQKLLPQMLKAARAAGMDSFTLEAVRSLGTGHTFNAGEKELAKEVLKASPFISAADKRHGSAKLLALNKAEDKALLEIYIDRGTLAEETYHVVVNRYGQSWKFFSITLISVS
jgi:hypothetical protein